MHSEVKRGMNLLEVKREMELLDLKKRDGLEGFTWMLCVSWICDTASVVSAKADMQMIHRAPPL